MDSFFNIETVSYQNRTAEIKQIRTAVFQQEQGISADLEFDGLDASAVHLLASVAQKAIATARVRAISGDTVKIERLAVLPAYRKQGVGTKLMQTALSLAIRQRQKLAVVHAQAYIAPLYTDLGFEIVGDKFSEAGIEHVKMIKQL